MSDPFADAKSKLAWANKRFADLQREVRNFGQLYPYKEIVEPHPDKPGHQVRKIRLIQALPPDIAHITAEIVNSLRSTLDVAGYAIALACGKSNPKSTAFPFAGSVDGMALTLGGRCKDIPPQIQSLFFGFQPYAGGDDLLWALNEICNTEKHKIVIPIGTGAYPMAEYAHGTGFMQIPSPHVWNSEKNEMELITLGPGAQFDYEFDFTLFVAFGQIKIVGHSELIDTLRKIGHKVDTILVAIEAESRRLGFI
jgi:hypothetical protein